MKVLRAEYTTKSSKKHEANTMQIVNQQWGTGDRSERIRTYNFPQNRVTDHRIRVDYPKLDQILAGKLDEDH